MGRITNGYRVAWTMPRRVPSGAVATARRTFRFSVCDVPTESVPGHCEIRLSLDGQQYKKNLKLKEPVELAALQIQLAEGFRILHLVS
jgi:hypothetical protein